MLLIYPILVTNLHEKYLVVITFFVIFAASIVTFSDMGIKSLRLKALMECYAILYKSGRINNKTTIIKSCHLLVNSPAPSFFLNPSYVRKLIFAYERGDFHKNKLALQLQQDVYNAYLRLKAEYPLLTKERLIEMVADQPAPRFYINPNTAARRLFWPQKKKNK